ncbi:MAG: hydrolase, partial [Leptospiraceae bacterium]|nr:hydrolase [Leptospiraceae bacterium]
TAQKIKSGPHIQFQPTDITKILSVSKNSKSWRNLRRFASIHENKVYEDPSLWYKSNGCDRVAFYMNKRAFEEKMNLLRKYELHGFSFWQLLSNNDPAINDYLKLLMTGKLPPVKTIVEERKEMEERLKLTGLPVNKDDSNKEMNTEDVNSQPPGKLDETSE